MSNQQKTTDKLVVDSMVRITESLRVGDVIQTNESFGPNPVGSIGIVYETYADPDARPRPVVSVLLINGHDIGSFTGTDQDESLTRLGHVDFDYTYVNPGRLMQDFREGYFRQVLATADEISRQQSGVAVAVT